MVFSFFFELIPRLASSPDLGDVTSFLGPFRRPSHQVTFCTWFLNMKRSQQVESYPLYFSSTIQLMLACFLFVEYGTVMLCWDLRINHVFFSMVGLVLYW